MDDKFDKILKCLKQTAKRRAFYDDEDWMPEPGNADDTYEQGCKDGNIELARYILGLLKIPYEIEE